MDFSFLPKNLRKKEKVREFFLALLLKPSSVGAILFEQAEQGLVILSSHEILIENNIQDIGEDELVQASDEVISAVEHSLPEGAVLQKTIFALPHNFVQEGKITQVQLKKFKRLCEELDLIPVGFIVSIEAIAHFLQKKEGVPLTGTFVEVAQHFVTVYMVKAGSIVEVNEAPVTETMSLAKTVEGILKSVTSFQTLPSKMVLLAYTNVEKIHQEFLSFPWTKDLPFLHLPQVTVLEKGFEDEAIINGVATQMGFELPTGAGRVTTTMVTPAPVVPQAHKAQESDTHIENNEEVTDEAQTSSFGFVQDADIAQQKDEEKVIIEKQVVYDDSLQEVDLPGPRVTHALEHDTNSDEEEDSQDVESSQARMPGGLSSILERVASFRPSFGGAGAMLMQSKKLLLIPVILILLIAGFSYVYYNFLVQAEVILFVDKKTIDKAEAVTFSPDVTTDPEKGEIQLNYITVEQKGSAETPATGKKDTGEKAKGEITLYNKTEEKKAFEKGTVVIGPNKLEYVLADTATIASTSAFSTNFSNAKVKVEALKFGSEYNIPSGSNFSVKGSAVSSYFAKNDQAFSGGSKKEVTVVSAKDLKDLEASIVEDLKAKALPEAQSKAGNDVTLIEDMVTVELKDKVFSKKEGQEDKKVTLTGTVVLKLGSYAKEDIDGFIATLTKEEVSSDYELLEEESASVLEDITVDDDETVTGELKVHAVYTPKISVGTIAQQVRGKSKDAAEKALTDTKNLSDHKIILKRTVPLFPEFMPMRSNNIKLSINKNG